MHGDDELDANDNSLSSSGQSTPVRSRAEFGAIKSSLRSRVSREDNGS